MNFLFWKRKEVAPRRPHFDTFPWICWFIWKARNDKLFNGKVVSSMDTLQHATLEAEFWRKANEKEEEIEDQRGSINLEEGTETLGIPRNPTCQIDASWINDGSVSGLGWSLKDYMDSENFGMRACHQCLSALHAEMEGLIWATACIRNMRITSVKFETDCSDLVEMITEPTLWPAFASEIEIFQRLKEDFEDISLCISLGVEIAERMR
ncbi:hypothetical protein N665_1061s0020 [Sinapis alba]|nr:hypothetical protein N665_1061s0020 [Sinapis alba]